MNECRQSIVPGASLRASMNKGTWQARSHQGEESRGKSEDVLNMTRLQPWGAALTVAAQQLQPTALAAISSHVLAGRVQPADPTQRLRSLKQANHTTCCTCTCRPQGEDLH